METYEEQENPFARTVLSESKRGGRASCSTVYIQKGWSFMFNWRRNGPQTMRFLKSVSGMFFETFE